MALPLPPRPDSGLTGTGTRLSYGSGSEGQAERRLVLDARDGPVCRGLLPGGAQTSPHRGLDPPLHLPGSKAPLCLPWEAEAGALTCYLL